MNEVPTYIIEVNEVETRLTDPASVSDLLMGIAASVAAEVWVMIDHGRRRLNFLDRLFGGSDRDVEFCFWLAKAGDVAAITFLDRACSEYRAVDPAHPVRATDEQRMALSGGEPTPAPTEVCLRASRAIQAAVEYVQTGRRPIWMRYHYVP